MGMRFQQEANGRIQAVRDRLASRKKSRSKVLTIEWIDPIYVGGMWLPEMIEIAGGQVCIAERGQPAPIVSREDLKSIEPDVVIVKPCGYKLDQTLKELDLLKTQMPEWRNSSKNLSGGWKLLFQPPRSPHPRFAGNSSPLHPPRPVS